MLSLTYTLPNATTMISDVGAWSSPIFNEFLPLVYLLLGVVLGLLVLHFVGSTLFHSISNWQSPFQTHSQDVGWAGGKDNIIQDSYLKAKHAHKN